VFVCGACIGTAQVGVSLVSLVDPLFKRSRLHCLVVCLTWYLWPIKVWWRCLHRQSTPGYATIPIWFKRSRLHCLHVCWRAICDIYKFDDGTHLQGLNTTQVRHHTHSDLSTVTCRVCFVKHMMIMRQYLPRLWYDSYPLHAWCRSLSFF